MRSNDGLHGFSVKPNRVAVGGSVKIKGVRGNTLYVLLPDGTKRKIKMDGNGEYTLKEPLGREGFFTISDYNEDPQNVVITVYELVNSRGKGTP